MEQRDAIVKNLREISHYFLSESESNPQKQTGHKEPLPQPDNLSGLTGDVQNMESENIKYIFNSHTFHPLIQYIVHYDNDLKIAAQVLNVALELTGFGNKTCVVGRYQVIKSLVDTLGPAMESVSSVKDGDEAEIYYLKMAGLDLPLILIGRKTHLWNAQISRYIDGVRKVFITDFTINTIKDLISTENKLHLIFFTKPQPEKALRIYADLHKLYEQNRNLWCGIIVNDTRSISEGMKVYNAISGTLVRFEMPNPHYLGTISNGVSELAVSPDNNGNRSDFYQIADRIVYHLPFIISSSK